MPKKKPCKSCQAKRQKALAVQKKLEEGHDFSTYSTAHGTIRAGDGKNYALTMPLVKRRPVGGYALAVKINNISLTAHGRTPHEVVSNVIRIHEENGVEISAKNAWFNANILWIMKSSVKSCYVTLDNLKALNAGSSKNPAKPLDPSPEDWGGSAWRTLGAYIASENFSKTGFKNIVNIFNTMVGDNFIGCEECYEHFQSQREAASEVSTASQAAKWMHETMNLINKNKGVTEVTWEQAVVKHRWENI